MSRCTAIEVIASFGVKESQTVQDARLAPDGFVYSTSCGKDVAHIVTGSRRPMQTPSDQSPNVPADPRDDERRLRGGLLRDIAQMLLVLVIVFTAARTFFLPYQVDGASMSPSLSDGEHIFVNRTAYSTINLTRIANVLPGVDPPVDGGLHPFSEPQRGDIIVLESDLTAKDSPYIKRIIGLPGETVTFDKAIVFVDGKPLVEDYIPGAISECQPWQFCSVTVPEASVYVLGDNRGDSEDSRTFGPIPDEDIVGKAWFSNWPYEEIGPISHPDYGEADAGK